MARVAVVWMLVLAVLAPAASAATPALSVSGPLFGSPQDVTRGPDGRLWFTAPGFTGIGTVALDRSVARIDHWSGPGSSPAAIVAGADGAAGSPTPTSTGSAGPPPTAPRRGSTCGRAASRRASRSNPTGGSGSPSPGVAASQR